MTTTLEHTETSAEPRGGGLARHQNFATAIVGGVVLAWVFWFIARKLFWNGSDNFSDQVAVMTGAGWMIGFWIGIGAFNAPFRWVLGNDNSRDALSAVDVRGPLRRRPIGAGCDGRRRRGAPPHH